MSCYGYLALLLKKWNLSHLGSHSLGFHPSRNIPPTIFIDDLHLLSQRCWLSQTWPCPHANVLFHTWGCEIQLLWISLFTLWGILFIFLKCIGLLTHLFISYMTWEKINIPISCMLILEYYSPPLPTVACPQATARIELRSLPSSCCSIHMWYAPPKMRCCLINKSTYCPSQACKLAK